MAASVLIVSAALTGCAGDEPQLTASAAEQLQSGVLAVTTAAAAGDFSTAKSALATVQDDVLAAADAGDVTAERASEIQAAIELVAADLDAAIAKGTPAPTKAPEPTTEPAPSAEPTPEPTPTQPTEEPTKEPTEEPTKEPTKEPVPLPTTEPTPDPVPTVAPTEVPTPGAEPTPTP